MKNIWLVLKHEIIVTMGRPSYWIMTFLFPTAILLLNVGVQVMVARSMGDQVDLTQNLAGPAAEETEMTSVGYVDPAGLILRVPESYPENLAIPFASEEQALAALEAGEVSAVFLIASDYVDSGDLVLIEREFSPFGRTNENVITLLIDYNLTGDETLATALSDPVAGVSGQAVAPVIAGQQTDTESPLAYIVPYAVLFVFFFLITMSSGFMLQSVSREKENRTVEVLLLSLAPREMMLGKILGLCLVALFQMAMWLGGGLLLLSQGGTMFAALSGFQLPAGFLFWAVLYFLAGYMVYAALMGAIGALAPNAREGGQFTFLVLLPLMIPLWFNYFLIENPNGMVAVLFSLFPLTAPTTMMTRLAASSAVPLWQVILGLALLTATAYGLVLLAARFFRADNLLSTSALRWGRLLGELRRREGGSGTRTSAGGGG